VKVLVNDIVVGMLSSWTAFALTGLGDQRGKISIQLLLVNPAGITLDSNSLVPGQTLG
jgi:hypothetical protein